MSVKVLVINESEDSIDSSPRHYKDDKEWTGYNVCKGSLPELLSHVVGLPYLLQEMLLISLE